MDRSWNTFLCPSRSPDFKPMDISLWDLTMRAVFVSAMPQAFRSYKCVCVCVYTEKDFGGNGLNCR